MRNKLFAINKCYCIMALIAHIQPFNFNLILPAHNEGYGLCMISLLLKKLYSVVLWCFMFAHPIFFPDSSRPRSTYLCFYRAFSNIVCNNLGLLVFNLHKSLLFKPTCLERLITWQYTLFCKFLFFDDGSSAVDAWMLIWFGS